jgi:hypothetical protein
MDEVTITSVLSRTTMLRVGHARVRESLMIRRGDLLRQIESRRIEIATIRAYTKQRADVRASERDWSRAENIVALASVIGLQVLCGWAFVLLYMEWTR